MSTLKERISAAARELFLQNGPEGVSMRKVAERVGVSAPAIYHHYASKDDLLKEIIDEGLRILEDYLRPALERPTPFERLSMLVERFLDFALEQPKYFDFAFAVPSGEDERVPEGIEQWSTFRLAVEQVAGCMEEGMLRRDDPFQVVLMLWAEAHGLVMLYRVGRFGMDPEHFRVLYRDSIQRLLRGLQP